MTDPRCLVCKRALAYKTTSSTCRGCPRLEADSDGHFRLRTECRKCGYVSGIRYFSSDPRPSPVISTKCGQQHAWPVDRPADGPEKGPKAEDDAPHTWQAWSPSDSRPPVPSLAVVDEGFEVASDPARPQPNLRFGPRLSSVVNGQLIRAALFGAGHVQPLDDAKPFDLVLAITCERSITRGRCN